MMALICNRSTLGGEAEVWDQPGQISDLVRLCLKIKHKKGLGI